MTSIKEKLDKIASKEPSKWMQNAEWRIANKAWLNKSAKIAIKILRAIRKQEISQIELSKRLNVSPQQVSKIVKGRENLTLETISKIEEVLGVSLIEVPEFQAVVQFEMPSGDLLLGNYIKKSVIPVETYNYIKPSYNTMEGIGEYNLFELKVA
jgi:transcriptional regulator with XRE-family HTH domain